MSGAFKVKVAEVFGIAMIHGIDADQTCECGHAWSDHMLCTTSLPAVEGWIECPDAGCNCHRTWSFPREMAEEMRKQSGSAEG